MIVVGDPNTESASIFLRNTSTITHATIISLATNQKSESLLYAFALLHTYLHSSSIPHVQQVFRLQANAQRHRNNAFRHGVQSHDAVWPHLNLHSCASRWTLQRRRDGRGLPLEISKAIAVQVSKNTMPSKDYGSWQCQAAMCKPSYYFHK